MGGAGKAEATPSQKGQQEKEKRRHALCTSRKEKRDRQKFQNEVETARVMHTIAIHSRRDERRKEVLIFFFFFFGVGSCVALRCVELSGVVLLLHACVIYKTQSN